MKGLQEAFQRPLKELEKSDWRPFKSLQRPCKDYFRALSFLKACQRLVLNAFLKPFEDFGARMEAFERPFKGFVKAFKGFSRPFYGDVEGLLSAF